MYLKEVLKRKCEEKGTEKYYEQWAIMEKEVKDALTSINDYYKHYTLHGEEHTKKILNNIIKILGKEVIEKLSSFDIWLLLTSAYLHDIGMYLTQEKVDEILENLGFKDYLLMVETRENHPLHEYFNLSYKINEEGKITYKNEEYKTDNEQYMRYLIADYMRKSHGKESKDIINNFGSIGVSFSNLLLPDRIFKILGGIVQAHTLSFKEVMKLPKEQDGIGIEIGNPRFIACMLRLGDLLDIDNDRYSKVFFNNIKRSVPKDSLNHLKKHKAIDELTINTEYISVVAGIKESEHGKESYSIRSITLDWFKWIEEEFKNQLISWNKIVPKGLKVNLPTVEKLEVNMEGYETISTEEIPQFSIDKKKVFEILGGGSIYSNPMVCFRELIQNSIDATYLRVWQENKEELLEIDKELEEGNGTPSKNKELKKLLSKYKIEIELKNKGEKIEVIISDNGIGFSKEDLRSLETTGSSSNNYKKINMIKEMPKWFKPSGTFGVGFQSVFLLTDEVEMETINFLENKKYSVILNSPVSREGQIYLKEGVQENSKIGTALKFKVDKSKLEQILEEIPRKKWGADLESIYSFFDIEIGIKEEFKEKYMYSIIPVFVSTSQEKEEEITTLEKFEHYFKEEGIEASIELSIGEDGRPKFATDIYYKNQYVFKDNNLSSFIKVNILDVPAKDILTLDREGILSSYKEKLEEKLLKIRKKLAKEVIEELLKVNNVEWIERAISIVSKLEKKDKKEEVLKLRELLKKSWKKEKLLVHKLNTRKEAENIRKEIVRQRMTLNSKESKFCLDSYMNLEGNVNTLEVNLDEQDYSGKIYMNEIGVVYLKGDKTLLFKNYNPRNLVNPGVWREFMRGYPNRKLEIVEGNYSVKYTKKEQKIDGAQLGILKQILEKSQNTKKIKNKCIKVINLDKESKFKFTQNEDVLGVPTLINLPTEYYELWLFFINKSGEWEQLDINLYTKILSKILGDKVEEEEIREEYERLTSILK